MRTSLKEIIQCCFILLRTSTQPKKDRFWLSRSILLTLIKHPDSILNRTTTEAKKHFLSDYFPHPIIIKTEDDIFFIARPKFDECARFLFAKAVAKWEPLSIIQPKENDVIVDVGANVGYYTLRLSRMVGRNGQVFAIDADPKTCEVLKKNCELNNLANVQVHNFAITDKKGTVSLYTDQTHSGKDSIISNSADQTQDSLTVPATTLDDLLGDKYPEINWMKIDVEGAELRVLKGASNTLKRTRKILIELHEHILKQNNETPESVLEMLKKDGFRVKLFNDKWDPQTSPNISLKSDYILAER